MTLSGPAEGAFYNLFDVPAATCSTTDADSGVRTPAFVMVSGGPTGPVTVTCTGAVDNVGNVAADVSVHYYVDATAPVVKLLGPADGGTYLLGAVPAASCVTTDTESGVQTNAHLTISGGPLGAVTATCSGAVDVAGNAAAPVSVHYTVVAYTFVGFAAPLNGASNTVKGGSTVPLKFQLFDWNGRLVTDTSVITRIAVGGQDAAAAGGTSLRFDPTSNQV